MARVVRDFAQAARNAVDTGFDGVELHGASGYLFEQSLNPAINDRTDRYGGSVENRLRFLLETVDAVCAVIGRNRVGIRLSPWGTVNGGSVFDEMDATLSALGRALGERGIAYVHVTDQTGLSDEPMHNAADVFVRLLRGWRPRMPRTAIILAGGMTRERADALISEGVIDLAAFGEAFIANPDLVTRLRHEWPRATADRDTFYTGGGQGFIDYPPWTRGRGGAALDVAEHRSIADASAG